MRWLLSLAAIALLTGSCLHAQAVGDKKLQALEKSFTAEQQRLFQEHIDWLVQATARNVDPTAPPLAPTDIRRQQLQRLANMTPNQAKAFWRELPRTTLRGLRDLNPLHVTAAERKAAEGLPASAKQEVARLLSDKLEEAIAARRRLLGHGPTCRALIVDQLSKLPADSPRRMLHEDLLRTLDFEEAHQRRVQATETALQKASQLAKARGKTAAMFGVLVSRRICGIGGHPNQDPYGSLCYYNFLHKNHDYKAGVALEFGNGDGNRLGVNFYGGQDSRIESLGKVDYAKITTAPNADTTVKWWKHEATPMTAVVGHVYRVHVVDARDRVDFAVKFRIVDMSPEEWIIIEWEYIPQER